MPDPAKVPYFCVCGGSSNNPNKDCDRCQMAVQIELLRNQLASARAHHEADNAEWRAIIPKINALIGTSQHNSGVCKGLQMACDIIKGETND